MVSALEAMQKDAKEKMDARVFELQMEQFWKNWAPDDKYEAACFHAELMSLIRRVYIDAQEPIHKQLAVVYSAMPNPLLTGR